jgi:hypothetical protein
MKSAKEWRRCVYVVRARLARSEAFRLPRSPKVFLTYDTPSQATGFGVLLCHALSLVPFVLCTIHSCAMSSEPSRTAWKWSPDHGDYYCHHFNPRMSATMGSKSELILLGTSNFDILIWGR